MSNHIKCVKEIIKKESKNKESNNKSSFSWVGSENSETVSDSLNSKVMEGTLSAEGFLNAEINQEAVLTSFIAKVINNEVNRFIRNNKAKKNFTCLLFTTLDNHISEYTDISEVPQPSNVLNINEIENAELYFRLKRLKARDLEILKLHLQGYTDTEMSIKFGIARQTINKIKLRTIRFLQKDKHKYLKRSSDF